MKKFEELTTEQKLKLLCGKDSWHTEDFDGTIPSVRVTDASMGVRMPVNPDQWSSGDRPSVSYPSMQVLACTWNTEVVKNYAECVADDCLDAGADLVLGPGINIKRSPICGRNFEYLSEDPYLSGIMAKMYVTAMQDEGVGACIKHFCCNNLENNRFEQSSDVDERTLREIYYRPFEIACEARPVSLMSSYNRINGVYGSEYKIGYDILRNEFGFDGLIMSDWDAVRDRTAAAKAGLDLEMPFHKEHYEQIVRDYENGKISLKEIDILARRVYDFVERTKKLHKTEKRKHSLESRLDFARNIEEEGIVLLKNNGALPLKEKQKISVCGLFARPGDQEGLFCGGGSSKVKRLTQLFDIYEILSNVLGGNIVYETAFGDRGVEGAIMRPNTAVENASRSDVNIVFAGTGCNIETEALDRTSMKLCDAAQQTIIDTAKVNPNTVVVIFAGSPIDMTDWIDEVAAVVWAGFPGEKGGEAVVNVLTGKVNPSGKLTETFPLRYEDTPAAKCYRNSSITRYDEGINVGYRYYDSYGIDVLFPFGYGLSYSHFDYAELQLLPNLIPNGLTVNFYISNLSKFDGKEITQVYVRPLNARVYRPNKELKGFTKTFIQAGERAKVSVGLDITAFAYWSVARNCWYIEDGVYEIIVASSVKDERLKAKVSIKSGKIEII